jgi:hypothetical protein
MSDETEIRPGGEDHAGDAQGERAGEQSPLQGRAAFIKNWDWQLVTSLNRGSCDRGKALHGHNPATHERSRQRWEDRRSQELTFGETLDFLLECHRSAPFLFFNGNTFGEISRRIADAIFIEFPLARRREAASLAAHYVAGVLDRQSMEQGLKALAHLADFKPGDRVHTLKGSSRGVIVRFLPDGHVAWLPDGTQSELLALPETLLLDKQGGAL